MKQKHDGHGVLTKQVRTAVIYVVISVAIWGAVALFSPSEGSVVTHAVFGTFAKVIKIAIAVFVIVGLIQVWLTPQQVSRVLGKQAGWKGLLLASSIPMLLGGSLFMIFPLMSTLREMGARIAATLAFVSAWSGKAPLVPLEIEFLGWRFAVLRIVLIVPFAMVCGILGELILERTIGRRHTMGPPHHDDR